MSKIVELLAAIYGIPLEHGPRLQLRGKYLVLYSYQNDGPFYLPTIPNIGDLAYNYGWTYVADRILRLIQAKQRRGFL